MPNSAAARSGGGDASVLRSALATPARFTWTGSRRTPAVDRVSRDDGGVFSNCHEAEVVFNSGARRATTRRFFGLLRPGDTSSPPRLSTPQFLRAADRMAERGARVTFVAPRPDGLIDPRRFSAPCSRRPARQRDAGPTRDRCLQPVEEIGKIVAKAGHSFTLTRAGSGQGSADVRRFGCHCCSISAHKMHGPKGIAYVPWRGTPA